MSARISHLVDRHGRPMALYPTTAGHEHRFRPRPRLNRDTRKNANARARRDLVNTSRVLYARCGNLGTAIRQKNSWAFLDGWDPHYTGANQAWGDEAAAWLKDVFFPNCDRHGRWDWRTMLYLSGIAHDRDGDDLMILTEADNGSGFPKVEFIPGVRLGTNKDQKDQEVITSGPYRGHRIYDGVIFSPEGTAVAVRVLGADGDQETFEDIAIGFGGTGDLAYPPEWVDQGRGVPLVARVSEDWMDVEDIDYFLKGGIKRAAAVGLIGKTADGEAPMGNEMSVVEEVSDSAGTTHDVQYGELEGGEIYYMSAADGEDLKGLDYSNPHPNVENFIGRIERRAIGSVGWLYELIYLGETGRAATRLVCDLGNQSIWQQQSVGLRRTRRTVRYALAKAQKAGLISRNPDNRDAFNSWDFGLPKPLSVDAGNDEAADRDNLKLGTTSKAIVCQKKGYFWREIGKQRKVEILTNARDASDIESETNGKISFERAMDLLEQRTPNGQPSGAQPKPSKPEAKPTKTP